MKSLIVELEPRLVFKQDKTQGIEKYDIDNAYPQRVQIIVDGSGIATRITKIFKKFILGDGFENVDPNLIAVDRQGNTLAELVRMVINDYSYFNGFAIHVNYNGLGQISSLSHMPFEFVRMTTEDSKYNEDFVVYDDWAKLLRSRIDTKKFKYYHAYNPDIEVIAEQSGGEIQNYAGQLFYYSGDGKMTYPKAFVDPELETVQTDSEIKTFHNTNIRTSFMASHMMFLKDAFESDEDRDEFISNIQQFQGAKNASKVFVIDDIQNMDDAPKLEPLHIESKDKLFEATEKSAHDRIRKVFGIPPVLISSLIAGKLGTGTEIIDAINYYNEMTIDERKVIEQALNNLFSNFEREVPKLEIKPVTRFKYAYQLSGNTEI